MRFEEIQFFNYKFYFRNTVLIYFVKTASKLLTPDFGHTFRKTTHKSKIHTNYISRKKNF